MAEQAIFPIGWAPVEQYHPEQHLSKARSNGKEDYLAVAERMVWFVSEQRQMIVNGTATRPYVIQTEAVEINYEAGYAIFKTFIRDCLGNEATDYGTESRKDFADFVEKAATKSRGRALLSLGYGTAFAPELDEGERIVDTPRRPAATPQRPIQAVKPAAATERPAAREGDDQPANEQQKQSLQKLYIALGEVAPAMESFTFASASAAIRDLSRRYNERRRAS